MKIRRLHFIRLILRSLLFLSALCVYVFDKHALMSNEYIGVSGGLNLLVLIWLFFAFDMALRFFPSSHESMGCQKQFAANYKPVAAGAVPSHDTKRKNRRSVLVVAISWLGLNGIIGSLYLSGTIDKVVMLLISLFFSVCDIVCILFYCPFQSLMMKNRCCVTCRIYNWDFAMMFTPALFVKSPYTWSLLIMALGLVIRWEITYSRHPERFSETTNAAMSCAECPEKLCIHKKAIRDLAAKAKSQCLDQIGLNSPNMGRKG